MSQFNYILDGTKTRTNYGIDLQSMANAIVTLNSGATAPTTTYAYMLWYDTSSNTIKQRNSSNSAWDTLALLQGTTWYKNTANVYAYRTGVVGVAANVYSIMNGFTETQDTGNDFNASTGRFTAPRTGTYEFTARYSGTLGGSPSGTLSAVLGYKINGGATVSLSQFVILQAAAFGANWWFTLELTAADYVELYLYPSAGGTPGTWGGTYNLKIQEMKA